MKKKEERVEGGWLYKESEAYTGLGTQIHNISTSYIPGLLRIHPQISHTFYYYISYSLSTLSWRGRKTDKIGIHLTENGSNQRHVIFDGR